jgi:hypothetical protein
MSSRRIDRETLDRLVGDPPAEATHSFARVFGSDLDFVVPYLDRAKDRIQLAVQHSGDQQIAWLHAAGLLLCSGTTNILAGYHLVRSGFTLQGSMLLRNVVEYLAVAAAAKKDGEVREELVAGELHYSSALKLAKESMPEVGRLWGDLSDSLHVNLVHAALSTEEVSDTKSRAGFGPAWNERSWTQADRTIRALTGLSVLIDVVAELLTNDLVDDPVYWRREQRENETVANVFLDSDSRPWRAWESYREERHDTYKAFGGQRADEG